MAIDHGMGGSRATVQKKVQNLISLIVSFLVSGDPSEWEDLADELFYFMGDEFDTVLEDNSAEEVAKELLNLYLKWETDRKQVWDIVANFKTQCTIQSYVQTPETSSTSQAGSSRMSADTSETPSCSSAGNTMIVDEEEERMVVDTPDTNNEDEKDGWTLVRKK